MTMTMESGGLVYPGDRGHSVTKDPGDPFTSLLPPTHLHIGLPTDQAPAPTLTHHLVMSTKQQVNGTNHNHNHFTVSAPSKLNNNSNGNGVVKNLQIVESFSFENKINDCSVETSGSGEETLEAETSETESKFSSDEEQDETPGTPPEDYVELVEGYEMVSFETIVVPPPPPGEESDDEKPSGKIAQQQEDTPCYAEPQVVVKISEDTARGCLLDHVSSHVCYGREAAKTMVITEMEYVPALHYEIQTFTERRETCWSYAPHRPESQGPGGGAGLDMGGLEHAGHAPLPWELEQEPVRMFREEVRLVTVPNTGVVKTCHKCRGTGGQVCGECGGKGWVRCLHCHGDVHLPSGADQANHGSGSLDRDRCYYCQHSKHGHGNLECGKCKARGKVSCATCEGTTSILCFIQLSISWKINTSEHITDKLDIPEDLIRDVSGQVAYEEEGERVLPVDSFDDEVIKMASAQLVSSHASKFPEEKILRQRHQVRVVPVTKVNYEWKGRTRSFFVYGYENKVYVPDNSYPQSCCWGCNIM